MVLWCSGSLVLRFYGSLFLVLSVYVSLVLWFPGSGSVVSDSLVLWFYGSLALLFSGSLIIYLSFS